MLFSACQHDLLKNKIKILRGVGVSETVVRMKPIIMTLLYVPTFSKIPGLLYCII